MTTGTAISASMNLSRETVKVKELVPELPSNNAPGEEMDKKAVSSLRIVPATTALVNWISRPLEATTTP